jgi:pimeloyl-ACP methyl ester carboxylesterase
VWDEVRDSLDVGTTVAPRPVEGTSATLLHYAEAAIAAAPRGRFTVVTHSVGGVVGAEVARLVPDRVSGFLAVTAAIPRAGQSFTSAMPLPNRWVLAAAMRLAGTRPPDKVIRRGLGDGLPDDIVDRVVAEFTTESRGLYLNKAATPSWPARRGYVATTRDRELPLSLQERFAQQLDANWMDKIDAGHLPMVQNPKSLADSIHQFLEA